YMTAHGNLVAGEWVSGVETNRNLNPSNLDDVVGEYTRADAAQAHRAIAAAVAAAPGWARGNLQERGGGLHRLRGPHLTTNTEARPRRGPMPSIASATPSSNARPSSARSYPARRARPCPRASARPPGPATSSSSSRARECA